MLEKPSACRCEFALRDERRSANDYVNSPCQAKPLESSKQIPLGDDNTICNSYMFDITTRN
jgi:hypothetical protein